MVCKKIIMNPVNVQNGIVVITHACFILQPWAVRTAYRRVSAVVQCTLNSEWSINSKSMYICVLCVCVSFLFFFFYFLSGKFSTDLCFARVLTLDLILCSTYNDRYSHRLQPCGRLAVGAGR